MWWTTDEERREATDQDCIFCQVVHGELPSAEVYSDDQVYAFADINPVAPVHVLVVPKDHVELLENSHEVHEPLLGHLLRIAAKVAVDTGISDSGYRVSINQGPDAGQLMDHLHVHVIGGERLMEMGRPKREE